MVSVPSTRLEGRQLSVIEKLGVDGVGVVVVEDKDVLVPT